MITKCALVTVLQLYFLNCVLAQNTINIVTTDVDNFWLAYDNIVRTKDNSQQLEYLNDLFIEKATIGQLEMMKARRYAPREYVDAINMRPEFWATIRANTLRAKEFAADIRAGIEKLRKVYPDLKPADIYFTIGVFRSGGTTSGSNILIGSEIVFADEKNMRNLAFTIVHEYIHTQQKSAPNENLLQRSIREGIAEFVTVKALGTPSFAPAIIYGKNHEPRIGSAFARQMFNPTYAFWLYSDAKNAFGLRDLGYYVGYSIAERYYERAKNKERAIKELVEMDIADPLAVERYVDGTGYFSKSLEKLKRDIEKNRPKVIGIRQFRNGDKKVSPAINHMTIEFSRGMNKDYRNFRFGPLGEQSSVRIKKFIGFSEDGKSISFEIEPLQPNKRYQLVIGEGFRDDAEIRIKPYLIDFVTGGNKKNN